MPQPRRSLRKPRNKFHHGSLRAAAIELATAELQTRGYAELTLEALARKLGVTRPALYRHFKNRRALLQAVAQPIFVEFEQCMTEAFFSKTDKWEGLHALGRACLHFAVANRSWFRLQFTAPEDLRPMPDLEAAPARYGPGIQAALAEGFGPEHPDLHALYIAVWGMAHGQSMLAVENILGVPEALRLHEEALRIFVDALRSHARPPRGRARRRG